MSARIAYAPPLCVWKVIEEAASPEKHSIIRSLIGESKLEYASDLRNELETLLEIWNELNTDVIPARYRSATHLGLPEPPKQREMLVSEIHLLLENLKDKESGGLGFIPNDCNEDVISYTNHIIEHRTPTPTTPVLRSCSRNSSSSVLNNEHIEDVAKNIPVLDNESPIQVLQDAFQCECNILLEDIEYIRRCVEEGRCDFEEISEPSLTDLREERKKLENHLMKSIEISPAISIVPTQKKNSPRKTIKAIKPSTPVPKRRNLPPVRPISAVQYSPVRKEVKCNQEKGSPLPKSPNTTSLLGGRSHTDPSGNTIKMKDKLRRKSTSALPLRRNSTEEHSTDSKFSGSESSCDVDLVPGRPGIFCGTPDSGVSSRPLSELGLIDSLSIDNPTYVVSNHMSQGITKLELHQNSSRSKSDHSIGSYSESLSNYNGPSLVQNVSDKHMGIRPHAPLAPRPPMQGRKPSMQNARFHKIKATGNGNL